MNKILLSAIIFISAFIIVASIIIANPLQQTAYPQEYQIYKPKFPLLRGYDLSTELLKGEKYLPLGADLNEIYELEINVKGCGVIGTAYLNDELIGKSIYLDPCEFLTYPDKGGEEPYIHYQTAKVSKRFEGLDDRKITYDLKLKPEDENQEMIIQKITLTVKEMCDCTRSSHCPPITLDGKAVQSICDSATHKCTIDTGYLISVEDFEPVGYEEKTEDLSILNKIILYIKEQINKLLGRN